MKPLLFGSQPGSTGVTAAFYARNGMTGPASLMESSVGYFASASSNAQLDTGAWSTSWALQQPRRKLHACCGYLHSAVDAVGRLRADLGDALRHGSIEVRVPPYVADVVSKTAPPSSGNDARFHLQYCLALALCGSDVILPEHSINFKDHYARANVSAAMARIQVTPDPALSHYHQCSVAFDDGSGTQRTVSLMAPRGSPNQPLSDQDVIRKFHLLAEPVIGEQASSQFVDALFKLERCDHTPEIIRLVAR